MWMWGVDGWNEGDLSRSHSQHRQHDGSETEAAKFEFEFEFIEYMLTFN